MAFMAEVLSQFRLQGFLDHGFGQLLEQTVLANEVFGLFVIGQQSAEQRFRMSCLQMSLCLRVCRSKSAGYGPFTQNSVHPPHKKA